MEARLLPAALVALAAILSTGANRNYPSVRSQHFVVSAPTQQLATEICQTAEQYRRDLAIEWLGHELPPWNELCPIKADVAPNLGAGGATSFVFRGGTPTEFRMNIQGSHERILDSVLPHEITHTIFATHFGRPLPRWADEGACTTVEHDSEKLKQQNFLIQFLKTDRGIAFNRMFQMKDYPPDILPLYSQGYSLARFFIEQGGKPKYVEYIGEGMRSNRPDAWVLATKKYYGFNSLSDLQMTWVEWVRAGSPSLPEGRVPETLFVAAQVNPPSSGGALTPEAAMARGNAPAVPAVASNTMPNTQMASLSRPAQSRIPAGPPSSWQTVQSQNSRVFDQGQQITTPPEVGASRYEASNLAASPIVPASYNSASRPVSEGWYAKRRDEARDTLGTPDDPIPPLPPQAAGRGAIEAKPLAPPSTQASANQAATGNRVLLEWKRGEDQPVSARGDLAGVAANDRTVMVR
jgi:hypothetical protein